MHAHHILLSCSGGLPYQLLIAANLENKLLVILPVELSGHDGKNCSATMESLGLAHTPVTV